jgi:hypothetical protein
MKRSQNRVDAHPQNHAWARKPTESRVNVQDVAGMVTPKIAAQRGNSMSVMPRSGRYSQLVPGFSGVLIAHTLTHNPPQAQNDLHGLYRRSGYSLTLLSVQ